MKVRARTSQLDPDWLTAASHLIKHEVNLLSGAALMLEPGPDWTGSSIRAYQNQNRNTGRLNVSHLQQHLRNICDGEQVPFKQNMTRTCCRDSSTTDSSPEHLNT